MDSSQNEILTFSVHPFSIIISGGLEISIIHMPLVFE